MSLVLGVAIGASAGAIVSWVLLSPKIERAAETVDQVSQTAQAMIAGAGLALLVAAPVGWYVIARALNSTTASLSAVVSNLSAAANAVIDARHGAAVSHARDAAHEGVAWYAAVSSRRWIAQTAIGILIAFGSLIGSALLFRQIILLSEQNNKLEKQTKLLAAQNELIIDQSSKIDLQTITSEAQRRSGALSELNFLTQRIFSTPLTNINDTETRRVLDDQLISQLVNFSHSLTSYYTVETVNSTKDDNMEVVLKRSERARSPERAQLIRGLATAQVDFVHVAEVPFDYADLRSASFSGIKMHSIRLSNSDLGKSRFNSVNLQGADLRNSHLNGARFNYGSIQHADFASTHGDSVVFDSIDAANSAVFHSARLVGTSFLNIVGYDIIFTELRAIRLSIHSSTLDHCDFGDAHVNSFTIVSTKLRHCNFSKSLFKNGTVVASNLSDANLVGAHFENVEFIDTDLNGAKIGRHVEGSEEIIDRVIGLKLDKSKWNIMPDKQSKFWVVRPLVDTRPEQIAPSASTRPPDHPH
ncbi:MULTISPECIES: pentapeptide repeat-containing protein [unclassified Bosea (in: a-proteobacteria)]|uniref:pentapeptide repeat-containing protein n=1 Tax=unclassified Bosea (in: a-proteobacteria) TaxID=2653178 RepID=UPI0013DF5C82|nr:MULTISPECIES: pentapeptide repeat-containing protein [unclassified Bosea (in: a-proteobacteria)]